MTTQVQSNTHLYIDLETANPVDPYYKWNGEFEPEQDENDVIAEVSLRKKVSLSLIFIFWFAVFCVSLFSPIPFSGFDFFQTYGLRFVLLRYLVLTVSVAMMGTMSLMYDGVDIINLEKFHG